MDINCEEIIIGGKTEVRSGRGDIATHVQSLVQYRSSHRQPIQEA